MKSLVSRSQVAASTPLDTSTGKGYSGDNLQSAMEELRDKTIFIPNSASTSTNGTLLLTQSSPTLLYITGSATGFSVVLPDATSLTIGQHYLVSNTSSQPISVKNSAGTILFSLDSSSIAYIYLQSGGSPGGVWVFTQVSSNQTAAGVVNYKLTSDTPFSTTSLSDVIITGFSLMPVAGTYVAMYNARSLLTTTPKAHWWSFYKGGVAVPTSERSQDTAHSNQNMVDATIATLQFSGSETIDVRVRTQNGTLTINSRTLVLIRLGA